MSKEEMLSEDELSIAAGGAHVSGLNSDRGTTYITPTADGEHLEIWDGTNLVASYEAEKNKKGNLVFHSVYGFTSSPKVAVPAYLQYRILGPGYQV